jgi:hypothetical protein
MNKLLIISMFATVLLIAPLVMAQPVVTGAYLHSDSGSGGELVPTGGIAPGAILPFDIDTGYNASQAYQFRYMEGMME